MRSARATFDIDMMRIALRMAERGLGTTAPNPSVGAVVANESTGEVIARGWTQPGGRPHAETEALLWAGQRARGATLYVTLEPCSHHGKTPPCVDAIMSSGIKRVVIGVGDPDVRVAGQGVAKLKAAGIDVMEGVCADDARWVTLGHISRLTRNRPFVQLKLAVSSNGIISHGLKGVPVWVTGENARAHVHLMRAEADAILTGIGTVLADDPELTCRLPGMAHRSPVRVVLDRDLQTPLTSKLVQTAPSVPVWIICASTASKPNTSALEAAGVRVMPLAAPVSPEAALAVLATEGITRVMVEAGPKLSRASADTAGLVDEVVVIRGPAAIELTAGTPLNSVLPEWLIQAVSSGSEHKLGDSVLRSYRPTV